MNTQYYKHTCLCGCNGMIEIKKSHKYDGIPNYINGHNKTNGNRLHGDTGTKLFNLWLGMRYRCNYQKHKSFKDYGGRGIAICPEWTNDYTKFRDWALNNGYQEGLEIDRIDNDGNYEPSNCRFITHIKNCQNRSSTKLNQEKVNEIRRLHKIKEYSQHKLAKKFNISQTVICNIINNKIWKNTLQI